MNRTAVALTLIMALLFSAIAGACLVKLAQADPYFQNWVPPPWGAIPLAISISSPQNNTIYKVNNITLAFNINAQNTSLYDIDGIYFKADWMPDNVTVYKDNGYSGPEFWEYNETLWNIPDGEHSVVVTAWGGNYYVTGQTANIFEMTTTLIVNFTIADITPPRVSILSSQNKTYSTNGVPLNVTVNEPSSKLAYSLDGQDNVTIAGNQTLTGLSSGKHNLTVYAQDNAGNVGASETVSFSIEPFPTTLAIIAASGAALAVVAVGLLVYFKKRKHQSIPSSTTHNNN
jgi:hypothetical protein